MELRASEKARTVKHRQAALTYDSEFGKAARVDTVEFVATSAGSNVPVRGHLTVETALDLAGQLIRAAGV